MSNSASGLKWTGSFVIGLSFTLSACAPSLLVEDRDLETSREYSKLSEPSLCSEKKGREILKRARERERLLLDFAKVKAPDAEMSLYAETLLKKKWKKENHDELSKAFLIIGLSKLRLQKAPGDLIPSPGAEPSPRSSSSLSLEDELIEKGIDLFSELRKNPFIQSSDVYDIILKAIQKDNSTLRGNSAQALHSILLEKLADWQNLASSYQVYFNPTLPATDFPLLSKPPGPDGTVAASTSTSTVVSSTASLTGTETSPATSTSPAATAAAVSEPKAKPEPGSPAAPMADPVAETEAAAAATAAAIPNSGTTTELLERAQKFLDQNKFTEAITVLKNISKDERYPEVQTKIKEVCNRAVHELRTKAAKAFQSAMPVTDSQVRRKYLLEAQKFLDLALNSFTEADQIQVVRENLNIVNKNLGSLK